MYPSRNPLPPAARRALGEGIPYGTAPRTSLSDATRWVDAACILDVMPFLTVTAVADIARAVIR